MRVLYVNPGAELGGSERSLLDLLTSLRSSRFELEMKLVLFADGELARRVRELGIDVDVVALPEGLAALGEYEQGGRSVLRRARGFVRGALAAPPFVGSFRRALRAFQPTLVHTNGMKAHFAAALAMPELPRVVHLRDFVSERPLTRHALSLLRRNALFLTNSHAVEDDALGVDPSLATRVVYNGIDLEHFRPGPRYVGHLAEISRLEAPAPEAVTVGLVATYAWWKGHKTFIAAAARVRALLPERSVRFYVIGGPVYRTQASQVSEAELRDAIERAGLTRDVGLVPFQNDVARAYQGLDIVVHASERPEPFGRTIVEAMASGRAVVVARAGGALELFSEGRSALGFEPGNPDDLARAIAELVRDGELRKRLAVAGRGDAEARFGRERLAPEIVAAYRELVKRA